MNIIEMVDNYECLQMEYNSAEEKAVEYESRYDEMVGIGYSEEDSYTHSMACSCSLYEDKMEQIEKEQEKCDIRDDEFVAKQLIKEFQKIEINILMQKLHDWFEFYGDGTEVFTQPLLFMHSEEGSFYDDMLDFNYINDFNWHIKENEYFIIKTQYYKQKPTIKSYSQKEFFDWLEKELSMFCWWDGEMTEELEAIIRVIYPNYYHFN